jgi:hypothetical protein
VRRLSIFECEAVRVLQSLHPGWSLTHSAHSAMKVPAAWITLSLTAGSAFAAAWFFARRDSPDDTGRPTVIAAIAEAASAREAKAAAASVEKGAVPAVHSGVLNDTRLREALGMTDLAAAMRHIMKHEGDDHCADTRLVCLVEQLSAARLAELPAALAANMGNDFIVRFVLTTWAERDAANALAWVQATPALNATGTRAFLTGWMRAAPDAALAWLDSQPRSTGSDNLRTAVVEAMAEQNPAAALEMMKTRGWIANSPTALVKLMQNWGGSDPQGALDGLRNIVAELNTGLMRTLPSGKGEVERPNQTYTTLLRALLFGAYERNPADAAALFPSFTADELIAGSEAFAEEVLARDPAAGAALFTANPDARTRQLLLDVAYGNPSLALQNLDRIADPALRSELLRKAISNRDSDMRMSVPPEAQNAVRAALSGISDEKERHETAGRLAVENVAASSQWAAGLWRELSPVRQYQFGAAYLRNMAEADPAMAVAEFRQSSPEVQNSSLKSLAYSLAQSQPAEALQLVLEQTHRATQSESAATLFARWAQVNSAAALAALEQHAAQLDLTAIAEKLPEAGHLRVPFGAEFRSVPAKPVADKVQQLLGNPASDE